jgi:MFS family permease
MHPAQKIGLLASLYLAQGLPFGFFTQALPVLLREQKVSLKAIGFTTLLALPWALKALWAPIVDRRHWPGVGRRRSWILPLQGLAVVLALAVATLDPDRQLHLVLAAVLLTNFIAATQDIATDGLAVSLLTHAERGLGNGVQVAAYRVGMILGGGALLIAYARIGWGWTFAAMAGLLALASLPVALWREPWSPQKEAVEHKAWETATALLRRPGMPGWLALLVAYKFGEALGGGMIKPMLVDLGLDMEGIGWMYGFAGFTASLVGAMIGGWLTGRMGRRPALLVFGVAQASGIAAWLFPAVGYTSLEALYLATIYDHLVGSLATAALFTAMMDVCDPETGGTDYTLQASVVVLATGLGSGLAGLSAESLGWVGHYVFGTALTLAGAFAVAAAYREPERAA